MGRAKQSIFVSTYHSLWYLVSFWETQLRFGCFSPRADIVQSSGLAFLSTGFSVFYAPDVQESLDSACFLPITLGPRLAFPCLVASVLPLTWFSFATIRFDLQVMARPVPSGLSLWLYSLSCWFHSPSFVFAPLATNPGSWNGNLLRLAE